MHWRQTFFLIACLLLVATTTAATPEPYDALLQKAFLVRSSNPHEFAELMDQLRSHRGKVTLLQSQRYRYLEAYELGLYRDKIKLGAEMAKQLFKETKDPALKYRAGGLAASFSAIDRDFREGLNYLQLAMGMRKSVSDREVRHEGISNAALYYTEIGQHQLALRYADEVLADKPSPRMRCFAGQHAIVAQFELQPASVKPEAIDEIARLCDAQKEYIPKEMVQGVLARQLAMQGKAPEAIALIESMLPEIEATRYVRLIAGAHALLADLKLKMGDIKAAEANANITIALGEQIKSSAPLVSAYNTLYQIASRREKPTTALELYKRYAEAEIAHQNDAKAKELAFEIVRHETLRRTQQQNQQIALLEQNNKLLRLQQTLDRENAQKARLATVFLMLLLAGIVFWAIQVKRHQAQLQRLAQTDGLTGMRNRHFFTQKSERTLVDAARAGEPAALVMFDLDHFKAINDTYGHGAGDWVLKQVGKTCSAHCRRIDYLSRIGGEEFAVLLRGFDLAAAARMAEDCRSQLAQIDTRESGYSFVVTASFGVSSTAESGYDLSRLLSHADQMLYRAKNEGRNRVCAYTAETAAERRASPKRSPSLTVVGS